MSIAAFVPSTITLYGAVHTAISFIPLFIGGYLYVTKGTIDLRTELGKIYFGSALIGAVTGITIFHHGGPGIPHIVSALFIVLLLAAAGAKYLSFTRFKARTIEIISLSVTYFFLWFFTTTEGLTRLPAGKPFSPSPEAPELAPVRGVLLLLLIAGIWWQLRAEKKKLPAALPAE
ncbi:hypothetical protein [Asticcacaulis sp. YBE204]|uniref:hypothetical protein n=1 Tax=Asticcacaulis sp. YBE204 TaxID=1282363 RepID=UPI0003C3DE73|nr:hypothetical protein [Asticcacaulis sp. YBE204]ESQ81135.1 hypothetical protein AEYBE204_02035 [Asticcacaulis sp. YBE204]